MGTECNEVELVRTNRKSQLSCNFAGLNRVGVVGYQGTNCQEYALRQQHYRERYEETRIHFFALHGGKSVANFSNPSLGMSHVLITCVSPT